MPQAEMQRAMLAAGNADLILAIGSSLLVYPAAGLPLVARENGAVFLILNRGETGLDDDAHERFDIEAGPVLARLAWHLSRRVN
ncbi:MAG: hypothetical protein JOY97_07760 [Hyphomicrobiales bacterium]|nr:hypothetical protein [Hyphomicrobiales bacterium]